MIRRRSGLVAAVLGLSMLASAAAAQTADEVIAKHFAALGGRDAIAKLTSRKATGTATVGTPNGDLTGPIETYSKAPNKTRFVLRLDLSSVGAPGEMVVGRRFDGAAGVAMNSMTGDTDITGDELENLKNAVFPTPLLNYKEAGASVEVQAGEPIDGKATILLVYTPKTGSKIRIFLDAQTYLIVRTVVHVVSAQMGEVDQVSDPSDYRDVDGVKVPFMLVNTSGGQTVTIKYTTVQHNVAIDDAIFGK